MPRSGKSFPLVSISKSFYIVENNITISYRIANSVKQAAACQLGCRAKVTQNFMALHSISCYLEKRKMYFIQCIGGREREAKTITFSEWLAIHAGYNTESLCVSNFQYSQFSIIDLPYIGYR